MMLPNGWKKVKLGDVAQIFDGTHQTPEYVDRGIPFVSVENIGDIWGTDKFIAQEAFDAYYDKLDVWNQRHRWHPAADGGIIADLYFQLVGERIEISWNNKDQYVDVVFDTIEGGFSVNKDLFVGIINEFLNDYAERYY